MHSFYNPILTHFQPLLIRLVPGTNDKYIGTKTAKTDEDNFSSPAIAIDYDLVLTSMYFPLLLTISADKFEPSSNVCCSNGRYDPFSCGLFRL